MKTSDVEAKYSVTKEALRYYIERGLLKPACVDTSFEWSKADELVLKTVLKLREMGLTIESIVDLKLGNDDSISLKTKLLRRMEKVREEIEAIDAEQRELAYRKDTLENSLFQLSQEIRVYEESN